MKRVSVLAPGPSLMETWRPLGHDWMCDAVIAVNTAGRLFICDWVVFSDQKIRLMVERGEIQPRVGIVTHHTQPTIGTLQKRNLPLRFVPGCCKFARLLPVEADVDCCPWTFPNALEFANGMEAAEVHVFGFDCSEQIADVAGHAGDRTTTRWRSELPWVAHRWRSNYVNHSPTPPEIGRFVESGAGWHHVLGLLEDRDERARQR